MVEEGVRRILGEHRLLAHPDRHSQGDQTLLGSVVQVAFEPTSLTSHRAQRSVNGAG